MPEEIKELSMKETMKRYPLITAHIIAESLGYATPSCAARILMDAIRNRHYHTGLMANYKRALGLVKRSIETGQEPLIGSWF